MNFIKKNTGLHETLTNILMQIHVNDPDLKVSEGL